MTQKRLKSDPPRETPVTLDGRNRAIVIAESLARVIASDSNR